MNTDHSTTRFTLRVPIRVRRWVKLQAKEKGVSDNAFVSFLLQEKMEAQATAQK